MSSQLKRMVNLYAKWETQGYYSKNNFGIRNYLKWKFGRRCSICGNTEWRGQEIPLIVDHKDGNASNGDINNHRLVCPNCHSQTETFSGKNREQDKSNSDDCYFA